MQSTSSAPPGRVKISLARSWLVVVLLVIAGPWAMVAWGFRHLPDRRAQAACDPTPASASNTVQASRGVVSEGASSADGEQHAIRRAGPWGVIETTPITMMPPPEYIQESLPVSPARAWYFAGSEKPPLDDLFRAAGLTDGQRDSLWKTCHEGSANAFVCSPDDAFVRDLVPDARAHLYTRLGLDERNIEQDSAFRFSGPSVQAWLAEGGLRQDLVTTVERLAYRNHDYWMFADLRLVDPLVQGVEERTRLLRTLAADQTYLVRLRVDAESNIDEVSAYWGRGGRAQQVRPIIEALSHVPGGASLGIRALLPPFAQTRLSTYQSPTLDPIERQRDCHWTTMNFFATQPDDAFLGNPDMLVEKLKTDYYPVFGNFQLGDVVLFMAGNNLFHSAVYIADDILFTKNGPNPSNPWMFARLQEVTEYYPQAESVHVAYYRRKDLD